MNKAVCILPLDVTTVFLRPIHDIICQAPNVFGVSGNSTEDEFYEKLHYYLTNNEIDTFIFLGHGCSSELYGSNLGSTLIGEDEYRYLSNKNLIIFACRSNEFINKIPGAKGIGFGLIPTTKDDIADGHKLHKIDLAQLESPDLEYIRNCLLTIWVNTLKVVNINDVDKLKSVLSLFVNREIYNTLMNKDLERRRLIADILYYIKADIRVIP